MEFYRPEIFNAKPVRKARKSRRKAKVIVLTETLVVEHEFRILQKTNTVGMFPNPYQIPFERQHEVIEFRKVS